MYIYIYIYGSVVMTGAVSIFSVSGHVDITGSEFKGNRAVAANGGMYVVMIISDILTK